MSEMWAEYDRQTGEFNAYLDINEVGKKLFSAAIFAGHIPRKILAAMGGYSPSQLTYPIPEDTTYMAGLITETLSSSDTNGRWTPGDTRTWLVADVTLSHPEVAPFRVAFELTEKDGAFWLISPLPEEHDGDPIIYEELGDDFSTHIRNEQARRISQLGWQQSLPV